MNPEHDGRGCIFVILALVLFWAVVLFLVGLALGWSTLEFA